MYVVLCYVVLGMLCCLMLCYDVLCTLCCVRCVVLWSVLLCEGLSAQLLRVAPLGSGLCCVVYVVLCTLCCVMLCCVVVSTSL